MSCMSKRVDVLLHIEKNGCPMESLDWTYFCKTDEGKLMILKIDEGKLMDDTFENSLREARRLKGGRGGLDNVPTP